VLFNNPKGRLAMRFTAVLLLLIILVVGCNRSGLEPSQSVASVNKDTEKPPARATDPSRFSSWGLSCEEDHGVTEAAPEKCAISQIVTTDSKSGRVLLGVTVDYLDSPTVPTIHFRFSATAKPAPGIGVKIDEQAEMRLPISDCNAHRCEASGRLVPDVLKLFQTGRVAQVAFIAENDKQVTLPVMLNGFDIALAALNDRNNASR
jgi:invasion protein IalB